MHFSLPLGSTLLTASLFLGSPLTQAQSSEPGDVSQALAQWQSAHGAHWRTAIHADSGWVELLYGGQAQAPIQVRNDADLVQAARHFIVTTRDLHGIAVATLREQAVTFLPLAATTDKFTVRFEQEVNGIPVEGGRVNVLLDTEGGLLSLHSTAQAGLEQASTTPSLSLKRAEARALQAFRAETQLAASSRSPASLVFLPHTVAGLRVASLAWKVDVIWEQANTLPVGRTLFLDAGDGTVLASWNLVHEFDVSGTVLTNATPGSLPDSASNPATQQVAAYAKVTSSAGTTFTDVNGDFTFSGVNSPLAVTVDYTGTFNNVNNNGGSDYSLTATAQPGQANTLLMNPSPDENTTAQANAFGHVNTVRDYVRAIVPSDNTADFVMTANVNQSSTCNAFFDGSSTNYYRAGGGCANTAYSTVVAHEVGHWLNVRYGTGNGNDGMGEGNADVWAMYIHDVPIVGRDFCGTGCNIRSGNNTKQFCGDCCSGCYGQVHSDGEVWMGAAWKVRRNLNTTLGDALGDAAADSMFMGWMNAYNQTQIKSIIETQWLTLDDDDGNIDNGTPNYGDIDAGFREQGFPGFELTLIDFQNVTDLPDTTVEAGPYSVDATITSLVTPPINTATLHYRVNGAAFIDVPMTNAGGDLYQGQIPDVPSPARIDYYLSASDSGGSSDAWPSGAPANTASFAIGELVQIFADDFDGGGDGGWTHGTRGNTANVEDDWARGLPQGQGGTSWGTSWTDPSSAPSGNSCWSNDLGMGADDGAYSSLVHNYLRSPAIDCSSAFGTTLRFKRWLTVEKADNNDFARILVNDVVVWENASGNHTQDTSWMDQEIDIAAEADGQAALRVEFELRSGWVRNLGGWNIDDFELYALGSTTGQCPTPAAYGTAKTNSQGWLPAIGHSGTPSVASADFAVTVVLSVPNQPTILISGAATASIPFMGGTLWVAAPHVRHGVQFLDSFGSVSYPITVDAPLVGTTRYFQFWNRDPADSFGVGLSDGLEVTFCD
ncbi:MAG: hypothetical protein QF411_08260 [Planctomycetota bacterium]|jgi:hypothetical protein|nr:hypothetical protein [Planctomycetota bacterium]